MVLISKASSGNSAIECQKILFITDASKYAPTIENSTKVYAPHTIGKVYDGSPAGKCELLHEGCKVVSINNIDLRGLKHSQVGYLKSLFFEHLVTNYCTIKNI